MAEARLLGYGKDDDNRLYDVDKRRVLPSRNFIFRRNTG